MVIRAEGVGADQLCQTVRLVGVSAFDAAHFMQDDGHASARDLPCCFTSGHAAADNMDGFHTHAPLMRRGGTRVNKRLMKIQRRIS